MDTFTLLALAYIAAFRGKVTTSNLMVAVSTALQLDIYTVIMLSAIVYTI